ncbi:MAG: hypothetical protein ACTTH8_05930 [Treponema sp.]
MFYETVTEQTKPKDKRAFFALAEKILPNERRSKDYRKLLLSMLQ